MYEAFQTHRDILAMFLAAVAVFCAVIALAWPYLFPDVLGARMRRLADAWQWNRLSGAGGPTEKPKPSLLASEPKRIYAAIVRRLRLARQLEDLKQRDQATELLRSIGGETTSTL